ncbi:MAG: biotin/lipoyl-containing protein [Acidimicrobiales bacterium]
MSTEVVLPKWGLTMEDATIVAWHVAEGDIVEEGQLLAEVETEKIENELLAPSDGVVVSILVAEDETVDVGTVLAVLADEVDGRRVAT